MTRLHIMPAVAATLALGLAACDTSRPVGPLPDDAQLSRSGGVQQVIDVDIHDAYSGDPRQDPGIIHLDDGWVFVEILDPLSYRPAGAARGATPFQSPNDVRIGASWETGVPAESFVLLDLNSDGVLDIRLRWDLEALEAAGHLPVGPTTFDVWARDGSGNDYHGEAEVEVVESPPPALEDLVVVNDGNFFFDIALDFAGAGNAQFVRNVVTFANQGPRSDGTVVWWDRGRNSATTTTPVRAQEVIAAEGFTTEVVQSHLSDLFLNIPANVRSIWLWTPRIEFTTAEINALKQFIGEGGRILFIGENGSFYGATGLAVMNNFLMGMGVGMRTIGGNSGVGFTSTTNIAAHPLMAGISLLRFAGAGILTMGPASSIMFWDHTGDNVLGATEAIDPTPLSGREVFAPFRGPYLPVPPGLSESGQ